MLLDQLYAFNISGTEAMLTATTVAKVSDALSLEAANLGDCNNVYFNVYSTNAGDSATGASFLLELKDCDTVGGSYVTIASKTVTLAVAKALGELYKVAIPKGTRQFLKSSITGAASMTGGTTFKAFLSTS